MNPNKQLWEKGDFTRIAETIRQSAQELVASFAIVAGMEVLDIACGDGNTALPAARLGADVLGIDIAGNLVAAATERAQAAGLKNCRFQEGDASDLTGIADGGYDLVISIFGAMFAPRPFDVAKEMVRVTKPGGRIIMGNWIPGDPTLVAQILKISAAYTPPPPDGFVSPMTWGNETHVTERFGAAGIPADRITFARNSCVFRFPGQPTELLGVFRDYYGPSMNAFAAAREAGKLDALQAELDDLFKRQNQSGASGQTVIPATFLRVVVAVPR